MLCPCGYSTVHVATALSMWLQHCPCGYTTLYIGLPLFRLLLEYADGERGTVASSQIFPMVCV